MPARPSAVPLPDGIYVDRGLSGTTDIIAVRNGDHLLEIRVLTRDYDESLALDAQRFLTRHQTKLRLLGMFVPLFFAA